MLKIKNNVDLNILKDYGFEHRFSHIFQDYDEYGYYESKCMFIDGWNREISVFSEKKDLLTDTLYRLISDGLVEPFPNNFIEIKKEK